jgi:LysM repeat protein
MSDKDSAKKVLDAHYRRQQMSQRAPVFLIVAALLLVVGAAAVIFWALGAEAPSFSFMSSATPTATATGTATNTATPSPTATETETPAPPTETPTATATETPSGPSIYIVQEGDLLSTIADKFGTDIFTLLALNPQIDATTLIIRLGDQIVIPAPNTQLPTATSISPDVPRGTLISYAIQSGDTLEGIAVRFNSTVEEILAKNPTIENANDIQVGQIIQVPVNIATPVPTATQGTVFPTLPVAATGTPTATTAP